MTNNNIIDFQSAKNKNSDEVEVEPVIDNKVLKTVARSLGYLVPNYDVDEYDDLIVLGHNGAIHYDPLVYAWQFAEIMCRMVLFYEYNHGRPPEKQHYVNCMCNEDNTPSEDFGVYAPNMRTAAILAAYKMAYFEENIEG